MEETLAKFVHALRNADVEVTPAETLDAMAVLAHVGVAPRKLLKDALSLTLAKTIADKARFEACFEQFFNPAGFVEAPKQTLLRAFDHAALLAALPRESTASQLVTMVVEQDRTGLAMAIQREGALAGALEMRALRDKPRVAESIGQLLGLGALAPLRGDADAALAVGADYIHRYVSAQIRHYVDAQYALVADATGRRTVLQAALTGNLAQIPKDYEKQIEQAVDAFAEGLRRRYRRRQTTGRRGVLDVRRMLRRNVAYDGALFDLAWQQRRRREACVYIVCDVSGSVARLARFLLIIVHQLTDVLPRVRTFAFSNRLGEVTDAFKKRSASTAAQTAVEHWGGGNTDYGQAWLDLRSLVGTALNRRDTLIVLGDGRNNLYEPRADVLKILANRVGRVIWLNPEPRNYWGEGDSEMRRYAAFCQQVERLATLSDLKRITERLVNQFS